MIEIKPYDAQHVAEIAELIVPIQAQEFGVDITYEDQPDLADINSFYLTGAGGFWLAFNEDKLVGTIALKDIGSGTAALRKMFVHKKYRGKEFGVAAGLLKMLLAHSQSLGLVEILLGTTEAFKAAHRFYEKNDFVQITETDLPETFPRMKADTRFYRKKL